MRGIVVCVHPRAAEEGAKVLEAGGNAFDAAVATGFVQMVVAPFSCGVAGMISAHLWASEAGEHQVIDGCLRAGSLVTADMWADDYLGEAEYSGTSLFEDSRSAVGYTAICTPGAVAGFSEIHARYCTIPWEDLLQPAIGWARQGFPVTPMMRATLTHESEPHIPYGVARAKTTPDCARIYLRPDGSVPEEGTIIRNPDYASTLEHLARYGAADFYGGELARAMAEDLAKNGAFATLDDLRQYRTSSYHPNHCTYRDYQVFSNSPPGGGHLLLEALNVLDGLHLGELEHGGVEYLDCLASTLQLVSQDRKDFIGDPDVIGDAPGKTLLSGERAERIRGAVLAGVIGGKLPPPEEPETTHLSVVDSDGNVASITHSLGQQSGVVTPGLGFIYNNGMNRFDPRPGHASSLAPRKARLHMMMPSMAFRSDKPAMVLGAPGGNAILSALTQVFTNVADYGMTAVEAVSAPRIHAEGSTIWCEARTRTETCEALRERGYDVVQKTASLASGIAVAQLVVMGPDGKLDGGSDPRGDSAVMYT